VNAKMAACRTAAAAVLADYQRAADDADVADRALWAARLADMLGLVLAGLGAQPAGPAAQLEEIRLVLDAFDWETDDRQYALEQIDDILNRAAGPEKRHQAGGCWCGDVHLSANAAALYDDRGQQ
jgi:hypothetical protein